MRRTIRDCLVALAAITAACGTEAADPVSEPVQAQARAVVTCGQSVAAKYQTLLSKINQAIQSEQLDYAASGGQYWAQYCLDSLNHIRSVVTTQINQGIYGSGGCLTNYNACPTATSRDVYTSLLDAQAYAINRIGLPHNSHSYNTVLLISDAQNAYVNLARQAYICYADGKVVP